jgi:NAD(P)-dependent dehydrogenase (short-subunit alcohol dehydrogenase family)
MSEKPLQGRVALITGGSRGLGRAMALALAEYGAAVALVGRDAAKLEETAGQVRATGAEAEIYLADVASESPVEALKSQVLERFGKVHILVNNAGMNLRKQLHEFTLDEWMLIMNTNLTSVFLMCKAFVPQMKTLGYGRILNMTSIMSHISLPGRSAYSSTKAALLGLTRALALELANDNITVNGISPGPFGTEINTLIMQNPELNAQFLSKIPWAVGAR